MKLSEFQVKAAGLKKPGVSIGELGAAAELFSGEECACALARMLQWICVRCGEIGWTFQEVAEMAVEGQSDGSDC